MSPQNSYAGTLTPKVMISGDGAFGGNEVMRLVPLEWDLCLYKRDPREFFSSFHHVMTVSATRNRVLA